MNRTITIRCPAKVNLALSVGAPTADGYHPIASWMVAIDLYDELTVEAIDGPSRFDIDWADDAPQPSDIDWPIESDLIHKAHRLLERRVGRPLGIGATLRKRIPVGAGLAGGSTDGAGMFKALRQLFELKLSDQTLIDLSMEIGSDLAFFFSAGSAIVTGRGEGWREAALTEAIHLCLIMPSFGCPTGAVYRAFDQLSPGATVDEAAVERCVVERPLQPFNDLAAAAGRVQPHLIQLRRRIAALTGRDVHITGSGAGMFIVAADAEDARQLAEMVSPLCRAISAVTTGARSR